MKSIRSFGVSGSRVAVPLIALVSAAAWAGGCTTPFQGDGGGGGGAGAGGGVSSSAGDTSSASSTSSTSSTSNASGSTGSGQGSGKCEPDQLLGNESIDPTCGLFVEAGSTGGDGSQAHPFGTLAAAFAVSSTLPIYACASTTTLDESIQLTHSEHLFGALSCDDWRNTNEKTAWTGPAGAPVVSLVSTDGALVQGFSITARDAAGFDPATLQGASSIAIWSTDATASILHCDLASGLGAPGGDGVPPGQGAGAQSDPAAFAGNNGHSCSLPLPLPKAATACTSVGGAGGTGAASPGTGQSGTINPFLGNPDGQGGVGQGTSTACTPGENGHPGAVGAAAPAVVNEGSLDATLYYAGARGAPGSTGHAGQGGGGGGGGKTDTNTIGAACSLSATHAPIGGSGAPGGCGGTGGDGGGSGGASIAIASMHSTLTLKALEITVATGGPGGAGTVGALGGLGGQGGSGQTEGTGVSCPGGSGGNGGNGGGGGGGRGGASIGIGYIDGMPAMDTVTTTLPPAGAEGGEGTSTVNAGATGLVEATHGFLVE